jgi:hypothetical protein
MTAFGIGLQTAFVDQNVLDLRYARTRVDPAVPLMAETMGRDLIQANWTPAAGSAYVSRISLVPGAYTTVTLPIAGTQGVTLANSFLGLYDTSFARLAVSADISVALAAATINTTPTFTLNYTVAAAGDFHLALLVGSATTMPALWRGFSQVGSAFGTLSPRLIGRTSATTLTALPDPLGAFNDGITPPRFYARYQ